MDHITVYELPDPTLPSNKTGVSFNLALQSSASGNTSWVELPDAISQNAGDFGFLPADALPKLNPNLFDAYPLPACRQEFVPSRSRYLRSLWSEDTRYAVHDCT